MRVRDVQHRVPVTVLEDAQIVLAVALEGARDVWELARVVVLPDVKVKTILYNYAIPLHWRNMLYYRLFHNYSCKYYCTRIIIF